MSNRYEQLAEKWNRQHEHVDDSTDPYDAGWRAAAAELMSMAQEDKSQRRLHDLIGAAMNVVIACHDCPEIFTDTQRLRYAADFASRFRKIMKD